MTLLEDRVHLTIDGEEFHGTIQHIVSTFGTAFVHWDDGTVDYVSTELIAQAQGYAPSPGKVVDPKSTTTGVLPADVIIPPPPADAEERGVFPTWERAWADGWIACNNTWRKPLAESIPTWDGTNPPEDLPKPGEVVEDAVHGTQKQEFEPKPGQRVRRTQHSDFRGPIGLEAEIIGVDTDPAYGCWIVELDSGDLSSWQEGSFELVQTVSQPTTTLSEEQLEEWERLANAATPGPWFDSVIDGGYSTVISPDHWTEQSVADVWGSQENADFIAESRTAVPSLIAAYRALRGGLSSAKKDQLREMVGGLKAENESLIAEVRRLRVENEELTERAAQYEPMAIRIHELTVENARIRYVAEQITDEGDVGFVCDKNGNTLVALDLITDLDKALNPKKYEDPAIPPVIEQQEPTPATPQVLAIRDVPEDWEYWHHRFEDWLQPCTARACNRQQNIEHFEDWRKVLARRRVPGTTRGREVSNEAMANLLTIRAEVYRHGLHDIGLQWSADLDDYINPFDDPETANNVRSFVAKVLELTAIAKAAGEPLRSAVSLPLIEEPETDERIQCEEYFDIGTISYRCDIAKGHSGGHQHFHDDDCGDVGMVTEPSKEEEPVKSETDMQNEVAFLRAMTQAVAETMLLANERGQVATAGEIAGVVYEMFWLNDGKPVSIPSNPDQPENGLYQVDVKGGGTLTANEIRLEQAVAFKRAAQEPDQNSLIRQRLQEILELRIGCTVEGEPVLMGQEHERVLFDAVEAKRAVQKPSLEDEIKVRMANHLSKLNVDTDAFLAGLLSIVKEHQK